MISCKNITKTYGDLTILNGIDAEIERGEVTVLIGPSGSGKTTFLKSLSLIENPSSGTVSLDGDSFEFPNTRGKVRKQFSYDGKQTIGVVFQNLDLIPHWTNRQNILRPIGKEISESEQSELQNLLELFKMEHFIDKLPHQCSRGEQQRVAFVRAVMLKPEFLFLDEITSALDPELVATLFKYLIELKNKGTGILIITHFLLFAQNVADKIIFISEGKLIEKGTKHIMISPGTKKLQDFLLSLGGIILNADNPKVEDVTKGVLGIIKDPYKEYRESKDVNNKLRLIYRILDQEDLSNEVLTDVYKFVRNNFSEFKSDLEKWLDIRSNHEMYWDKLDLYIRERLSNEKYPKHKAWIYLLSYTTAENWKHKNIIPLLESYTGKNNFINDQVATEMLKEMI
ncbi:MAG: hypothetical protein Aureis2KO_05540 [Aureisphaera sp.]